MTDTSNIKLKKIEGFLSHHDCDAIIALAKMKGMGPSQVDGGSLRGERIDREIRNSEQCWLHNGESPIVRTISFKANRYVDVPTVQEALQVLCYQEGGQYEPHYDEQFALFTKPYNRYATLLIYLNDDMEGGETVFPRLDMEVRPKKGDAIYFTNINISNRKRLFYSLHGGKKVTKGEKWVANKWIRLRD
jgi:prolyl 4-hydroxylase